MTFDNSIKDAARRASRATHRAMAKYREGLVTDEDDITGVLVGQLDGALEGEIGDLKWSTSIMRHRKGTAGQEKLTGADILIHVSLKTDERRFSKGVLVQAKRVEPAAKLDRRQHAELTAQCNRMLAITPSAFVFDYTHRGVRCGSASRIAGASNPNIHDDCVWTAYRFFLELFRCPVGDPRITSARAEELVIPNVVKFSATRSNLARKVQ